MQTGTINREQRLALLHLAYALLPGCRTIIAGGFAASYQQAQDVDLWVLGDPQLERAAAGMAMTGVSHADYQFPDYDDMMAVDGAHGILRCDTPLLPIHIIGTSVTSVDKLLAGFDISTHRWAVTRHNVLVQGKDATSVFEDGRVLVNRWPNSTDARVLKLQERYGITIAPFVADPATKAKPKKKDAAA